MMSQNEFVFLKTLHSRALNYHSVRMDQPGLIQPTSISSHSTCIQLHRRSVPRYRPVCKNAILKECKTHGSGNLHREVENSRA